MSKRRHGKPHATPTIGKLIGGAIDHAVGSVGSVGRLVGSTLGLPGLGTHAHKRIRVKPGTRPGIEFSPDVATPPPPGTVHVRCIDYSPDKVNSFAVDDLEQFLKETKPDWAAVRWVNIDGLHPYTINKVREAVGMHTLAAEDVLHVPQRPRAESYGNDLFVIARMLQLKEDKLLSEQISLFIKDGMIITFQEWQGDIWQPIRDRINTDSSRLRKHGASYLMYALLDAVVDHLFPIMEQYGDHLEELETVILENANPDTLRRVHNIKRELSMLRRMIWPMREVISLLQSEEFEMVSDVTRTYLRDVYDHSIQIVEIIETFREMAASLTDLYMSSVSNRMNETMKVLTIMASLFIPITFLAGIYGMNFENIPELRWQYSYPVFWGTCIAIVLGLLVYFKHKGWIGKD